MWFLCLLCPGTMANGDHTKEQRPLYSLANWLNWAVAPVCRHRSLWLHNDEYLWGPTLGLPLPVFYCWHHYCQFSSVQSLSCVWLFVTPWTAACQASLSITNFQSLPKLLSIESVSHPTISSSVVPLSSCLQSFPASGSFQMSQLFASGGQSIGASALASVLPMNIQDWFPLELTGLISFQSKRLSRVFSNTTVQKHQFFSAQPSL